MKKTLRFRLLFVIVPLFILGIVACFYFFKFDIPELFFSASTALSVVVSMLLMCPSSEEAFWVSGVLILVSSSLLVLTSALIADLFRLAYVRMGICLTGISIYTSLRAKEKFRQVRRLFKTSAAWCSIEDYSRMVFSLALFAIIPLIAISINTVRYIAEFCAFLLGMMLVMCIIKVLSGRTYIMPRKMEELVMYTINGKITRFDSTDSDDHMNKLYSSLQSLMSDRKLFLDEKLTLEDITRMLNSNKSYVSKTINIMSGRNFRQYINHHRVMYAMDMMRKDRRLNFSEIARMSGFNSISTFNLAFKTIAKLSPREWQERNMEEEP